MKKLMNKLVRTARLAVFLIPRILREGGEDMLFGVAFCIASCVVAGTAKYSDVPASIRPLVDDALRKMGAEALIEK